jgi:hypothetical protein
VVVVVVEVLFEEAVEVEVSEALSPACVAGAAVSLDTRFPGVANIEDCCWLLVVINGRWWDRRRVAAPLLDR